MFSTSLFPKEMPNIWPPPLLIKRISFCTSFCYWSTFQDTCLSAFVKMDIVILLLYKAVLFNVCINIWIMFLCITSMKVIALHEIQNAAYKKHMQHKIQSEENKSPSQIMCNACILFACFLLIVFSLCSKKSMLKLYCNFLQLSAYLYHL